ncbi:MAG: dihydropteroate synthase [Chloroflexi bacterium]|nr:dihydropteroate synthase [Chloroflexota bacterium]
MLRTTIFSEKREVTIARDLPTILIGERINPTGKRKLATALMEGNWDYVKEMAIKQVEAGAHVLDVNVGVGGIDEAEYLVAAIKAVSEAVDVPLCIDSSDPKALAAALGSYKGKALVNSVTGEEGSLETVLPLVKQYGAAVIALCMDEHGCAVDVEGRTAVARKIIDRADRLGIPREDIIVDCLTMTVGADSKAALVTLEATSRVVAEFDVNITSGASNISHGLPVREVINAAFLAMMIAAGLTAPIVDPTAPGITQAILAADLVMGRDDYAARYIRHYRKMMKAAAARAN